MKRVWLWWSTGKDSAWALHVLRRRRDLQVTRLVTTVTPAFGRVAMHGVRVDLLRRQAEAVGLPLAEVAIPYPCPNGAYEEATAAVIARAARAGVAAMAFGDLFLADVRAYREGLLSGTGIEPLFPLWGEATTPLAEAMVTAGLRAHLTCVDPRVLPTAFAGQPYDRALLARLPPEVDPCGENGEFHTLVSAGPMFHRPLDLRPGAVVERDGFVFADFLPLP